VDMCGGVGDMLTFVGVVLTHGAISYMALLGCHSGPRLGEHR
jgi:hypothetical protein